MAAGIEYYVDANNGNDANSGLSPSKAFKTIQKAANVVSSGALVHILPGVYRESIRPSSSGTSNAPITYRAENGPDTVIIRGSTSSSSLIWTQLTENTIGLPPSVDPHNVYYADITSWNIGSTPRFVVELNGNGQVEARLPLAREPDWNVVTEWKYPEYWWTADGGSNPAGCNPATDPNPACDFASRSATQLTDRTNDNDPPGVEMGNLTTLGNLTGGTLVAIDTVEGHYAYRATIIGQDVAAGRITVDPPCEFDTSVGSHGLGWGSKYYIEGKPYLLDTPGEWWYDITSKRLYLWPRTSGNPASMNIEISRRDLGIDLSNRSYINIEGIALDFFNNSAIYILNYPNDKSYGIILRNLDMQYANYGLNIAMGTYASTPIDNVIDGFTLLDSEIAYIDSQGLRMTDWWEDNADPNLFTHSGVLNTSIIGNEFHHLGFRSDYSTGLSFLFPNKLRFERNWVHDIAHNGVQFSNSVIQSTKEYGFEPNEIKIGDILVQDNIFERTCQLVSACAGIKIWGPHRIVASSEISSLQVTSSVTYLAGVTYPESAISGVVVQAAMCMGLGARVYTWITRVASMLIEISHITWRSQVLNLLTDGETAILFSVITWLQIHSMVCFLVLWIKIHMAQSIPRLLITF